MKTKSIFKKTVYSVSAFLIAVVCIVSYPGIALAGTYDGEWEGTTDQGNSIGFTVMNDKIQPFSVKTSCGGTTDFTFFTSRTITGSDFSISTFNVSLSGTFINSESCEGTWQNRSCSGTWSVSKKGSEPEPDIVIGDADGNDKLEVFDALLIVRYNAGLKTREEIPGYDVADVNEDGKVDIFDALLISKFEIGLIDSFKADIISPEVISVTPENDAVEVSLDAIITATFSEDIDPSTMNKDSFFVTDGSDSSIPGDVTYSDRVATFTPTSDLDYGVEYMVTITRDVTDVEGNLMKSEYVWSFITVSDPSNDIDDDGDGYTENEGDCNDADAGIHPDAEDIPNDGIDQDCSGNDSATPIDIKEGAWKGQTASAYYAFVVSGRMITSIGYSTLSFVGSNGVPMWLITQMTGKWYISDSNTFSTVNATGSFTDERTCIVTYKGHTITVKPD